MKNNSDTYEYFGGPYAFSLQSFATCRLLLPKGVCPLKSYSKRIDLFFNAYLNNSGQPQKLLQRSKINIKIQITKKRLNQNANSDTISSTLFRYRLQINVTRTKVQDIPHCLQTP